MDCPEGLGLVAEVGVGVEGGEDVGEESKPDILSHQTMGLQEASEPREEGQDNILLGELEDGEAASDEGVHAECAEGECGMLIGLEFLLVELVCALDYWLVRVELVQFRQD